MLMQQQFGNLGVLARSQCVTFVRIKYNIIFVPFQFLGERPIKASQSGQNRRRARGELLARTRDLV